MEFRCDGRVHGIVVDGEMEVKCRSKSCGAASGVVVLHYFDIATGQLTHTEIFADPAALLERNKSYGCAHSA